MKTWKQIKKKIKDIWYPFERNAKINSIFYHFPDFFDDIQWYSIIDKYNITDVTSRTIKNVLEIKVTTIRPGLLIGKGGRTFDELEDYLNRNFKPNVKLIIEECTLWQFNKYR